MMLRDYKCEHCGTITESLEPNEVTQIICPDCGHTAVKILSCNHGIIIREYGIATDVL